MADELRAYVGLPAITVGSLGVSEVGGICVKPSDVVYLVVSALPMGWSHSAW